MLRCLLVQDPLICEETNEKEEAITDENTVDLHQLVPVGGVYHIDALQLPPQVKQIKDWSMVEVSEEGHYTPCRTLPYPLEELSLRCHRHVRNVHRFLSSKLKDEVFK